MATSPDLLARLHRNEGVGVVSLARVLRIKLLRIRLATPTTNASTQRICQCLLGQDQIRR